MLNQHNQLNELIQSQSILAPVLAGVPPICLLVRDIDGESDDEFRDASEHPAHAHHLVENNVVINNEMSNNEVVNSVVVNNTAVDINVVETSVITNGNENQTKNKNEIEIEIETGNEIEWSSSVSLLSQSSGGNKKKSENELERGNLVDPGSSSLGFSQDSFGNVVEPSSSALVSSGSLVVASDARKRPLVGDGDSAEGSARRSKLPVRRARVVGKVHPPLRLAPMCLIYLEASRRLLRSGLALLNVLRAYPLPPPYGCSCNCLPKCEWSSFGR